MEVQIAGCVEGVSRVSGNAKCATSGEAEETKQLLVVYSVLPREASLVGT